MKRLLLLLLCIVSLLHCKAQAIVCDVQDGQPVIQASVYDEHGKIIGVTDIDGQLPNVGDSKTIRLTHIAYQPYAKISQGDLLVYSEVRQLKGSMKQRGHEKSALNLWLFDEYYPIEAEYLTKQKYKAEDTQPLSMTIDDIDHYMQEVQVPALSDDMQRKLDETRSQRNLQTQIPFIEVGQRKGKLLIKLHDYEGTDSLICTVIGNGNNLVSGYNKGKVLCIDSEMLKAGEVTISIKSHQTGTLIAETPITIRMENASIELQEVSVTGNKKKKDTPVLNRYNMDPPRGFKTGDPRIGQAASMAQLLTSLGIRVTYFNGDPYITTPDNAGLDIYVDDMNMNDDHDYVLNLVPANVKAIEYFTPNNATNGIFGVRPQSFTGKVPGVLFIFLNDGSEVVNP